MVVVLIIQKSTCFFIIIDSRIFVEIGIVKIIVSELALATAEAEAASLSDTICIWNDRLHVDVEEEVNWGQQHEDYPGYDRTDLEEIYR